MGHFLFTDIHRRVPDAFFITMLRNPIQRTISQYHTLHAPDSLTDHWRRVASPEEVRAIEFCQAADFDEFVFSESEIIQKHFVNRQVSYLGPTLHEAIDHLNRNFHVIGIFELFEESMALIRHQTTPSLSPLIMPPRRNISMNYTMQMSNKTHERLETLLEQEFILYEEARSVFSKRVSECINSALTGGKKFETPIKRIEEPPRVIDVGQCFFYHTMDIPGYGLQKGRWDLRGRFEDYVGHVKLRGLRVLDVGCASGFLSFAAEQAGAAEVYSFDMDHARRQHKLPFREGLYYTDHEAWAEKQNAWVNLWKNAYWLAHRQLRSSAKVFYGDVYAITRDFGQFDVSIVGSILEHLSDPVRALASIAAVTRSTLAITTPVLPTEERIARFVGDVTAPEIDYVFWVYSLGTYRQILGMLGFEIKTVSSGRYFHEFSNKEVELTTMVAVRA
jgi:2-polyprenyl-3-methyl-5-hydroxy-6-metoxy-1,4-benzoquinol methylase